MKIMIKILIGVAAASVLALFFLKQKDSDPEDITLKDDEDNYSRDVG